VIVDAHQHFWDLEREAMPWMTDEHRVIRRTFGPAELAPLLVEAGVAKTVLVQAACSDSDTDSMFGHAELRDWIGGVIAWIDLRSVGRTRVRLQELSAQPKLRGFRHLIHDERDPHWILRADVRESLSLLEEGRRDATPASRRDGEQLSDAGRGNGTRHAARCSRRRRP
jgi:L-fuconolactonase